MAENFLNNKRKGFTLIEVMMALFIFSILAILTMRGLQTTLNAKQKSQQMLEQLAEIEIAYSIVQQDIEQIVNRNVLEPSGGMKFAFLVPIDSKANIGLKSSLVNEFGYNHLEFTRTGAINTIIKPKVSDLLRVAYYEKDGLLVRHSWRQVDPTKDTLVDKRRLLAKVENLVISFVDEYGRATEYWEAKPSKRNRTSMQQIIDLPRGIIFNFNIKNYGNLEWVFALPTVLNEDD